MPMFSLFLTAEEAEGDQNVAWWVRMEVSSVLCGMGWKVDLAFKVNVVEGFREGGKVTDGF